MKKHTHSVPHFFKLTLMSTAIFSTMVGMPTNASAATFTVNNNNDSGAGSLRQAIIDARNSSGPDTIDLNAVGTILLNSPLIIESNDITFINNGITSINGQSKYRIMNVKGSKVSISGVTFTNGYARGGDGVNGGGGGLGAGGALFIESGTVKLGERVTFSNNRAVGGDGSSGGGNGGYSKIAPFSLTASDGLNAGAGGGLNGSLTPSVGGAAGIGRGKDNCSGNPGGVGGTGEYGAGGGGGGGGGGGHHGFDSKAAGAGGTGGTGGSFSGNGGNGIIGNTSSWYSGQVNGGGDGQGGGGAGLGGAVFVKTGAVFIQSVDTVFSANSTEGGKGANPGTAKNNDIFTQDGDGTVGSVLIIDQNYLKNTPIESTKLTASNLSDVAKQVANNPDVIRQLANFAHGLGFANAGGTKSQYVGNIDSDNFEILNTGTRSNPSFTIKARYNSVDKYSSGYKADQRLSIRLSNFKISLDPASFRTDQPRISSTPQPTVVDSFPCINLKKDSVLTCSKTFTHSSSDSTEKTTSIQITEGFTGGYKFTDKLSFGVKEVTNEFSFDVNFSASQGWVDGKTETKGNETSAQGIATVAPRSESELKLIAFLTSVSVKYTATARISFDITFDGILRGGDNAREDVPTNYPPVKVTINTDKLEGINNADLSNVTDETGKRYLSEKFKFDYMDYVQNFFKAGITFPLSGTFTNVSGTSVIITSTPDRPIDATLPAIIGNTANILGYKLSDLFGKPIATVTILSNPNNIAQGTWQFLNGSAGWQNIGNGQSLSGDNYVRFLPAVNYDGTPDPLRINFDFIDREIRTSVVHAK